MMKTHPVVSREEWLVARRDLLSREKEFTRSKDELSRSRREMPWVRVEKEYHFEGPAGALTLRDLFDGRSQLIIQHFMFGPGWEEGCVGCSLLADHADGANLHLARHDVSLVAVSRAPFAEIAPFKKRMGWRFPWVSSFDGDFNFDFHASFTPEQRAAGRALSNFRFTDPGMEETGGHSVFLMDGDGTIYHTYSTFNRGDESLINTYNYLDLTPLGRNETGPDHDLRDWVRHHDRYGSGGYVDDQGRYRAPECQACGKEAS